MPTHTCPFRSLPAMPVAACGWRFTSYIHILDLAPLVSCTALSKASRRSFGLPATRMSTYDLAPQV